MQARIVTIRAKDWGYIGAISVMLSLFLSLLCYFLVDENWLDGFLFGIILGLSLFACAFVLTTTLNHTILPSLYQHYWLWIAGVSSFLSGFLGTMASYGISDLLHVSLLAKFESHTVLFSFFIGFLSYGVAFLLYQFIIVAYAKEYHEKLLMHSRLKSLERQLNPHFLFNALNSLSELLHVNPEKAEKALLDLSDFLRFSIKESARISLHEEIENVKRYVHLENIRFEGKILLDISIDEAFLNFTVPKFSIQLIVENAIKHGFKSEPLYVWIEAHMMDSLFEIIIGNDGKAMQTSDFGIGLSNLAERLDLLSQGEIHTINTEKPTFKILLKEYQ